MHFLMIRLPADCHIINHCTTFLGVVMFDNELRYTHFGALSISCTALARTRVLITAILICVIAYEITVADN